VKSNFLLVFIAVLFLLTGCASIDEDVETPTIDIAAVESAASSEPVPVSPTDTLLPEPSDTSIVEQPDSDKTEIVSDPTETLLPEPTRIPCDGTLTSANQEGPYYSQGSPERASLIDEGMPGTPVLILGGVFNQDCEPVPGAKVDFWQADAAGEYDNVGFRLRGHVYSDQNGSYSIETIEPGLYTGRPPHIHVKVFAADGTELLTTQMYFPGSENSADVNAAPDLLVNYLEPDENGRLRVLFNFVVQN
jgi:protocatechuate 3,4-dioxygenase beta subunit